jgi:hypothetical protein
MPGKFNIDTIVSHINDNPLLHPHKYEVIVTGPVEIPKSVLFNCHRCDVPGHTIGSFDFSLIGPRRKIPNEEIFDDLSTTFYVNHHINELKVINDWIKKIGGDQSFRIAYYNDIVSDMVINIYDLTDKLTASVKVYEAYPAGISDINLAYEADSPVDVTVNWTYHSFEIEQKGE